MRVILLLLLTILNSLPLKGQEPYKIEVNVYGRVPHKKLLDTTWFARSVVTDLKLNRSADNASWFFFNSFWFAEEGQTIYQYGDFQNPLWRFKWYRYTEGTPNNKDFKTLLKLLEGLFLEEVSGGVELSQIYTENKYSNVTGTALLVMAMGQLEWPCEIRRSNGHLFVVIHGADDRFILDCSHLGVWSVSKRKSPYLDFLKERGYSTSDETSLVDFVEQSEIVSFRQLAALQKMDEALSLSKSNPAAAFYRLEVAHFLWPVVAVKEHWIDACRNLYDSDEAENNWDKVYAILTYLRLTGDQSPEMKEFFNSVLTSAFVQYSEFEEPRMCYPVSMSIRREDSYLTDEVLQKDTMGLLAAFDYDAYVHFSLIEPAARGLFHALSFETSIQRSTSDYQFYMDGLYVYTLLDSSTTLLASLYEINLINYRFFDDFPILLKDHFESGAIREYEYHKMCVIFYLSYLDLNAPDNVGEANKVSMSSLRYSVYLEALARHLVFVETPFLRTKAKEYVNRMIPIYKDKFISDIDRLMPIADICQVETHFSNFEEMSTSEKAKEIIRRFKLLNQGLDE